MHQRPLVTFGAVPKGNYTEGKKKTAPLSRTTLRCRFYFYVQYGLEYLLHKMRELAQKNNILFTQGADIVSIRQSGIFATETSACNVDRA